MPTYRAPAKINLTLEVINRRPDGYHNIASVVQAIDFCDEITIEPSDDLEFSCSDLSIENETNLVWRAMNLLHTKAKVTVGAKVSLKKQIPNSAGLGGGSSDAATTLRALNLIWNCGLNDEALVELGASLGSDVPFFIVGGTALLEGRGEQVTELPPLAQSWVVLLKPPFDIPEKTKRLYKALSSSDYSPGIISRTLSKLIVAGERPSPGHLYNSFEWISYKQFHGLDDYRNLLVEAGTEHVRLSGSGPTLYSIYASQTEARQLYDRLRTNGLDPVIAATCADLFNEDIQKQKEENVETAQ